MNLPIAKQNRLRGKSSLNSRAWRFELDGLDDDRWWVAAERLWKKPQTGAQARSTTDRTGREAQARRR